jgi:hypothetical protein
MLLVQAKASFLSASQYIHRIKTEAGAREHSLSPGIRLVLLGSARCVLMFLLEAGRRAPMPQTADLALTLW